MAGGGDDVLDTRKWLRKYGGAAPYWYVDPRAGKPPTKEERDQFQEMHDSFSDILDAINRIGFTPKGNGDEQPFSF